MDELGFRNWLSKNEVKKKVQSDCVSRIKRIEREINHCDIDEQYRSDKCAYLMSLFSNMGINEEMKKFPEVDFPIGKYHISTFRHALKQYVKFCDEAVNLTY